MGKSATDVKEGLGVDVLLWKRGRRRGKIWTHVGCVGWGGGFGGWYYILRVIWGYTGFELEGVSPIL